MSRYVTSARSVMKHRSLAFGTGLQHLFRFVTFSSSPCCTNRGKGNNPPDAWMSCTFIEFYLCSFYLYSLFASHLCLSVSKQSYYTVQPVSVYMQTGLVVKLQWQDWKVSSVFFFLSFSPRTSSWKCKLDLDRVQWLLFIREGWKYVLQKQEIYWAVWYTLHVPRNLVSATVLLALSLSFSLPPSLSPSLTADGFEVLNLNVQQSLNVVALDWA